MVTLSMRSSPVLINNDVDAQFFFSEVCIVSRIIEALLVAITFIRLIE